MPAALLASAGDAGRLTRHEVRTQENAPALWRLAEERHVVTEFLREAVAANRVIVLAVYGQVFFVMGLAVALQSWRHSRLSIAGSLKWLAAFGILHGLHEWGHIFIPLQAEYMPLPAIELLVVVQAALLAMSYACLFQFGVELLRPLPDRWRFVALLPGATFAIWVLIAVSPATEVAQDVHGWHRITSIWARYLMCVPGSLLAALGLWRSTRDIDEQLASPGISRPLRIGAYALAGYAFFSGMIVPAAGFFPASWLNDRLLYERLILPVEVYRGLMGAILAIVIIRGMEVFNVELDRLISDMEQENVLVRERERFGRDLHDHTLQKIYAAGLVLRSAEQTKEPEQARSRLLSQGLSLLDEAVADIRQYIGDLDSPIARCSLVSGLQDLASDNRYRSLVAIEVEHNLPDDCGLDTNEVTHLLAIAHEALSNAARHADASRVIVSAHSEPAELILQIADDGRGMPEDIVTGYGLRNMRDRAELIGADIDIADREAGGTVVIVALERRDEGDE